jgi:hypothetical protein
MQRRCWRWLWIWVGVLVAGCGQIWSSNKPPQAPQEPTLPLFGYTLLPPTLTPNPWTAHTATPLVTVDSSSLPGAAVALYLNVGSPACYETPVGSLVCLGQVRNLLDASVDRVIIAVYLIARDGAVLAAQETTAARQIIPAGASAPYRVVFEAPPRGYDGVYPVVQSARRAALADTLNTSLTLQEVSGAFVLDQYQVTLSIINRNALAVRDITITMILLDGQDQVTGFRQLNLGEDRQLGPSESLVLTVKVIPQGPNTVGFEAFAEGYLVK